MFTNVTNQRRNITVREQHRCSYPNCLEPAEMSCTDSILINGKRQESKSKFGCRKHPVKPNRQLEDGSFITWEEYIASQK
jgi:hypothetical protein